MNKHEEGGYNDSKSLSKIESVTVNGGPNRKSKTPTRSWLLVFPSCPSKMCIVLDGKRTATLWEGRAETRLRGTP